MPSEVAVIHGTRTHDSWAGLQASAAMRAANPFSIIESRSFGFFDVVEWNNYSLFVGHADLGLH
jgi:hypothetical protein